jgi:hypothetical protein
MGIQGVVVFCFWKAKGKEVGLGKQKNIQGTGEKILAAWPTNFCLNRGKFLSCGTRR